MVRRGRNPQTKQMARFVAPGDVTESNQDVQEISELPAKSGSRLCYSHLQRFVDAVDYDYFRAIGLSIGSGEVESAHRYIPQKRLTIPGATWHPDTINPMLALTFPVIFVREKPGLDIAL